MNKPAFIPGGMPPLRGNNVKAAINTKPQVQLRPVPTTMTNPVTQVEMARNNADNKRTRTRSDKKNGKDKTYVPFPVPSDSSSISGEDFSVVVKRTPFFDESKGDPVFFRSDIEPVYFTQNYDKVKQSNSIINNRLSINLARYHDPTAFFDPPMITVTPIVEHYRTIFRQMGRDVRSKIKSAKLYDKWNFTNWYFMIHATAEALEIFYTLDSILSYKGDVSKRTKNSPLMDLRRILELDSDLMYKKDLLRRRLEGAWFPKPFAQLIQWTYQNYRISDLPQAENIRFFPTANLLKVTETDDPAAGVITSLNVILERLDKDEVVALWSILSDVYPAHQIEGLPLSSNDSHYDKLITEIFCNQPVHFYEDSSTKVFPDAAFVTANAGYFTYGSVSDPTVDKVCGLPFVLQTIFNSDMVSPYIDFFKTFAANDYATDDAYYNTNKFTCIAPGGEYYNDSRLRENARRFNTVPDVHFMKQDITNGVIKWKFSSVRAPFQPVYFEVKESPLISIRDFMSRLFGQS